MTCPNLACWLRLHRPRHLCRAAAGRRTCRAAPDAPIWWNEQPIGKGGFNDGGFWVVTKHKDVKEVSLRSDVFSTHENTAIPRYPDDMPRENIDMQRARRYSTSTPRTTPGCARSSRADSPRAPSDGCVANSTSAPRASPKPLRHRAAEISSSRCPASCRCRPSPGCSVCRIEDRSKLFRWSNEMTGSEDPEYADIDGQASSMQVLAYAMQMADIKAKNPATTSSPR